MCPNFSNRGGLGAKPLAKNCCQKRLNQCLSLDWPKLKWCPRSVRRKGWLLGRGGRDWLLGRRVMDWFLGRGGRDCCRKLLAVQFTEKMNVMQQEH